MICPRIWKQYLKKLSICMLLKPWISKIKITLLVFSEYVLLMKYIW